MIETYNYHNPNCNHMFPEVTPGHHIAGAPPTFHHLKQDTPDEDTMEGFSVHIVKQEMNILMEGQFSIRSSDIAIVFGDTHGVDRFQNAISRMLKQEYNLPGNDNYS